MTVQFQISDLLSDVAFRLNMPTFATGQAVTDTQALRLAQNSARRLGDLFIEAFGANFFQKTATLTTQAGLEQVSLPADFVSLRALWWIDNANQAWRMLDASLDEYQPATTAWESGSLTWFWPTIKPTFRLQDISLIVAPVPAAAYTLRLEYATGIFVAASTDYIFGLPGWDEWIILDMCEMISQRFEKDASRFTQPKLMLEQKLIERANKRDLATPRQIRDVTGALDDPRDYSGRRWWWT